jgi:hypothetical protein
MCGSARRCVAHTPHLSHLLHTPHLSSSVAARTYWTLLIVTQDCGTSYILHAASDALPQMTRDEHCILHAAHLSQLPLLFISRSYPSLLDASAHTCLSACLSLLMLLILLNPLCMSVSPDAPHTCACLSLLMLLHECVW